jgi:hypothetical protein
MNRAAFLIPLSISLVFGQNKTTPSALQKKQQAIEVGVHVGKHQMGETFKQWLAILDIDLAKSCPPHPDDPEYYRRPYRIGLDSNFKVAEDRSAICLQLMPFQDTGNGETGDFNDKFSSSPVPDPYLVRWTFANGKLSVYSLVYVKSDMQEHIGFLTDAYGPPATHKFMDYQNAYGAAWKRLEVSWRTADGGAITLSELSEFDKAGQFMVIFVSGDEVRKETAEADEKRKANPYAKY